MRFIPLKDKIGHQHFNKLMCVYLSTKFTNTRSFIRNKNWSRTWSTGFTLKLAIHYQLITWSQCPISNLLAQKKKKNLTRFSSHETPYSFKAPFTIGHASCKYFSIKKNTINKKISWLLNKFKTTSVWVNQISIVTLLVGIIQFNK